MGLTNWRGAKLRKLDALIAKNYLKEKELLALNNLIEQYLIFAEGQAMKRIPMKMKDWIKKLNGFLNINDRNILQTKGKVSHLGAKEVVEKEYNKFSKTKRNISKHVNDDFDEVIDLINNEKSLK
jgi:hypothetical protein